jgi:transcriptional antiterminator RfaH
VINLSRQGFKAYLPQYIKRHMVKGQVEKSVAPLFPGYLFIAVDLACQRWRAINSTFGIQRLISHGETPTPVPSGVVESLIARHDEGGFVRLEPQRRLLKGDAVRVLEGAFANCLGLFEGIADSDRVAILLDMLGRKVRVVVESESIAAA